MPPGKVFNRHGFALLDVLVAGVLVGVVLVAVMGLSSQALSSQMRGEQIQTAAMLADERLNLVLMTGPDRYEGFYETDGQCDPPFQDYRYHLDIEDAAEGSAWPVTVTISWKVMSGEQTLKIETRIAPRVGDDPDPDRKPTEPVAREENS